VILFLFYIRKTLIDTIREVSKKRDLSLTGVAIRASIGETCHTIFNYLALCAEQPHKKV